MKAAWARSGLGVLAGDQVPWSAGRRRGEYQGSTDSDARAWVYRVAAGLLIALGALTTLTGGAYRGDLVQDSARCC